MFVTSDSLDHSKNTPQLTRSTTGATVDIAIWSTIEMGLAISAASFSTLRPLARSLGWSVGGSTAYASNMSGEQSRNTGQGHNSQSIQPPRSDLGNHIFIRSGTSEDTLNAQETNAKHTTTSSGRGTRPRHDSGTRGLTKSSDGVELTNLDDQKDEGSTGKASIREFIA